MGRSRRLGTGLGARKLKGIEYADAMRTVTQASDGTWDQKVNDLELSLSKEEHAFDHSSSKLQIEFLVSAKRIVNELNQRYSEIAVRTHNLQDRSKLTGEDVVFLQDRVQFLAAIGGILRLEKPDRMFSARKQAIMERGLESVWEEEMMRQILQEIKSLPICGHRGSK